MRWRVRAITRTVGEKAREWVSAPHAPISDGKLKLRPERMRPNDTAAVRNREESVPDMRAAARDDV